MKLVQVLFDEILLAEFDSDERVKIQGRSRVLGALVSNYLDDRRKVTIDSQYAAGYGGDLRGSYELDGWGEVGEWPAE